MTGRFELRAEPLPALLVYERLRIGDDRGFLERLYEGGEGGALPPAGVAQVNRTLTAHRGTVRGMHYQYPPFAEAKLVHCTRGSVLDVAVDLRRGSPTFLRWHAEILSAGNRRCLWIPEGFAHGFQALEDECEMMYIHSQPYAPGHEGGVHPRDPRLGIAWPLAITQMSDRDAGHPMIDDQFEGVAA